MGSICWANAGGRNQPTEVPGRLDTLRQWFREEDWRSLAHQLRKRVSLDLARRLDLWSTLQLRAHDWWTVQRTDRWIQDARSGRLLIGPRQLTAFQEWAHANPHATASLRSWTHDLRGGTVDIFDTPYRLDWAHMPWRCDWRTGKDWPTGYFRQHRHHGTANIGEVKFPWELSRMNWLLPLCEAGALADDPESLTCALQAVASWEHENPLAYSVNWHPMECAMRILNLSLGALILAAQPQTSARHVLPLLRQVAVQAEFLARNVEYTSLRSNHYAANLAGLAMAGHILQGHWPAAARWKHYAFRHAPQQVCEQFHPDGVQFEGSVAYHRLVTELLLLILLIMRYEGRPISAVAVDRLHRACRFAANCRRPDGVAPNWGDNDGARVLGFEPYPIADHRPLISLAASVFQDTTLPGAEPTAAAAWLGGIQLQTLAAESSTNTYRVTEGVHFLPHAGILCGGNHDTYIFADYGGIGLRGRGGHGHNDTFSFELCLNGRSLIVDAGCPSYTGDLAVYELFRSSALHNTLQVDGQELAPMPATWRIEDTAHPRDVTITTHNGLISVSGRHFGYQRLPDPVVHRRTLELDVTNSTLTCRDSITCRGPHRLERHLHLATDVRVAGSTGSAAELAIGARTIAMLRWRDGARLAVRDYELSPMFGTRVPAQALTLISEVDADTDLEFTLESAAPNGA